jgi:hypothetical protein
MTTSVRTIVPILVAVACRTEEGSGRATEPDASAAHAHATSPAPLSARDQTLVNELTAKVARYRSFAVAQQDGYTTAITNCMENRPIGGMGVHYGNTALIDGAVFPLKPEVLLYAPGPEGAKKFVGVEFIVPFSAWTHPTPPVLFGQTFAANQTFQVWALHVWTTLANPNGLFADWNPLVAC